VVVSVKHNIEVLTMKAQNQWLFEAPVILEGDRFNLSSESYNNFISNAAWENPPPQNLQLFSHFHTPKSLPSGKVGALTRLIPQNMNPGFIDAKDDLIANNLQSCLQKLIATQFSNYLSNKSNTTPAAGDRLQVAIVDLTGDKINRPEFAGWGSTSPIYGASVPKILALYAAYQLRMDLRQLAASQTISSGKTLEQIALQNWKLTNHSPNLVWLFNIRKWSGDPNTLDFTPAAHNVFKHIMHNAAAGELISKVGFPYIASVTWQSGLHHPNRNGLWLTTAYGKGKWSQNPLKGVQSANVTALAVATYFTLLAQGRLVDRPSSQAIRTALWGGCTTGLFPEIPGRVASKCGIYSKFLHDCALISRKNVRYVVVGLTQTKRREYAKYTQLFQELDKLIVQNNQIPKPLC
jgi:hypothetical protein